MDSSDLIKKHTVSAETHLGTQSLEADAASGSTGDRNDEMAKVLGILICFGKAKEFHILKRRGEKGF